MITLQQLRRGDPKDLTWELGYAAEALVRSARLALENDGTAEDTKDAAAGTLRIAEILIDLMHEGCESLEAETKRGTYSSEGETSPLAVA